MIVAKNCDFWSVFPQISCGRYPPNSSKFPKPHFLLTCTYLRGRRHGRTTVESSSVWKKARWSGHISMHAPIAAPQSRLQKRGAVSGSSTRCRTASRAKQRNGRLPAKTCQDTRHDAPLVAKTQRHATHENCLPLLSEARKEEVPRRRQREPPSEQAFKPRKCLQSKRVRNSKPPSEHAPKPHKNAAPHHPRKVPNVAFWSPIKEEVTPPRQRPGEMPPDASQAAASATANHHQNPPQNQTKTQRHTTHENCLTSLSEALKEEVTPPRQRPGEMPPDASQAAASATANHHQNPPQNQTKTQRHTTHENCLTSLSEALKEEVTPPRRCNDQERCLQMHPRPPLPQRQTTIRIRPKTRQKRSATPPTKTA